MTPTSLLRIAIALVGLMALFTLAGCRRLPSFFARPSRPSASSPGQTQPAQADLGQQALLTVTDYLAALEKNDYATAYDLLSQQSQSAHSRADFEQQGKQGMPQFDFNTAKTTVAGNDATVSLTLEEEPGAHEFHLTREGGAWKVVYRGGAPGQPYPD